MQAGKGFVALATGVSVSQKYHNTFNDAFYWLETDLLEKLPLWNDCP